MVIKDLGISKRDGVRRCMLNFKPFSIFIKLSLQSRTYSSLEGYASWSRFLGKGESRAYFGVRIHKESEALRCSLWETLSASSTPLWSRLTPETYVLFTLIKIRNQVSEGFGCVNHLSGRLADNH